MNVSALPTARPYLLSRDLKLWKFILKAYREEKTEIVGAIDTLAKYAEYESIDSFLEAVGDYRRLGFIATRVINGAIFIRLTCGNDSAEEVYNATVKRIEELK